MKWPGHVWRKTSSAINAINCLMNALSLEETYHQIHIRKISVFLFLWNSLLSGARIFCEFLCNQEWSELSVRHQNPITCYQLWQLWLLQQSQNNPLTIWLMRPSGDNFISLNSKYWLPSNRFLLFFIHVVYIKKLIKIYRVGKWHFTYFAMDCLNSHILHVTAENFL